MMEDAGEKFLNALMRRPYTRRQAEELLKKFAVDEQTAVSLMTEAEDTGLIDDVSFARLFALGHLHWGNLKIAHELSARGVSRSAVRIALDEAEDEAERACKIAQSWRKSGLDERKIIARLRSRGFTIHALSDIMK